MRVSVEFLGIPRVRAGCAQIEVQLQQGTLGEVLQRLCEHFPQLAGECLTANTLTKGYLACINETEFTTRGDRQLQAGDRILILSADVGG